MIEDHDKDRHASVVGCDSLKRISTSVLPCSLMINEGSPGTGWGPWWERSRGKLRVEPQLEFYPCSPPCPGSDWLQGMRGAHPTHLQDEQEESSGSSGGCGRGVQGQPEKQWRCQTWTPGSGQELTMRAGRALPMEGVLQRGFLPGLSSPKAWKVSVRGNLPPAPPLKPNLRLPPLWVLPEEGHSSFPHITRRIAKP